MEAQVSVIIPCYNYGHLLGETLENLKQQVYPHWEALIIDDGSVDDTASVAQEYAAGDRRFRYFRQENQGLSAARNTGLRLAAGDYFQFLDADDLLSPQKLQLQVQFMERHPETDISYTRCYYFRDGEPGRLFPDYEMRGVRWMPEVSGRGTSLVEAFLERNIMPVNSPLLRRTVLEKVSAFDTGMHSLEDWDFWLKCALRGLSFRFFEDSEAYALVRVNERGMTRDTFKMRLYEIWMRRNVTKFIRQEARCLALNDRKISEVTRQLFRDVSPVDLKRLNTLFRLTGGKSFTRHYFSALNYRRKMAGRGRQQSGSGKMRGPGEMQGSGESRKEPGA